MPRTLNDSIPPASVRAVIFDCDGLLVDSESAWSRVQSEVYRGYGVEFTDEHKRDVIGRSVPEALAAMERHLDREGDGDALGREMFRLFEIEAEPGHDEMPGASAIVRSCARSVPVAVASSADQRHLDANVESVGVGDLLRVRVNSSSVANLKPAPDPYLLACERLGVDPTTAVAFEDSATGAASAMAAGLKVIAVPTVPGTIDGAAWVAKSLLDDDVVAWAELLGA